MSDRRGFKREALIEPVAAPADTRAAPSLAETIGASFQVARADTFGATEMERYNAYRPVVEALEEQGLDIAAYKVNAREAGGATWNYARIWNDIAAMAPEQRVKLGIADSQQKFDQGWQDDFRTRTEAAQAVSSRGGLAGRLIGGIGGAATDPINLATLPFGGTGKTVAMRIASEFAVNAGVEALSQPLVNRERRLQGREEMTGGEMATNVAAAGAFGATFRGGIELAPKVPGVARAIDQAGYSAAKPLRDIVDPGVGERDLARALSRAEMVPGDGPIYKAAGDVLRRAAEIEDGNPFQRSYGGLDAHTEMLERATDNLVRPAAPAIRPIADAELGIGTGARAAATGSVSRGAGGFDREAVKAAIRGPESGGNDRATNGMGSSASGRYQFVRGTFKAMYRKVYGASEASADAAWQSKRFDPAIQERLMDRLLDDNAAALQRAGVAATPGNLYTAHVLGGGTATKFIKAAPDTPVSKFVSAEAIAQNPGYLGGGKSVSEALAVIRGKVGESGQGVSARASDLDLGGLDMDGEVPIVRADALDAVRPQITSGGRAIDLSQFRPGDIDVDAGLMQFKSGGDQFGVTDRLQGVQQWDPLAAGTLTVWEAKDGRRLIADGHQRVGLAKRMLADDPAQDITLNGFVLREEDGFTARDARILTALKNIGEGSGSGTDAAKVFRDAGIDMGEQVASRLPPRSALVRDGKDLARLSDEAFGAVVNEVLPENFGAAIGRLAPDPETHSGLVDLLAATDPPNRRQAEAIIRQALDAGFIRETQEELFGSRELVSALFAHKAKAIDRTLGELKKMKGAFQVAARNAETLEAGGNRIDIASSTAAAEGNARALALVERLAVRKDNAISTLFNQAAQRLAAGDPIGRVVGDLVRDIRALDLDAVIRGAPGDADLGGTARSADGAGDGTGGSGRGGISDDEVRALPDGSDELTPATRDELEAAGQGGFAMFDDAPTKSFDEPAGTGVDRTIESDWHDIRAAADASPDQAFDLDDGTGMRSAADIDAELSRGEAAIVAVRGCLT